MGLSFKKLSLNDNENRKILYTSSDIKAKGTFWRHTEKKCQDFFSLHLQCMHQFDVFEMNLLYPSNAIRI